MSQEAERVYTINLGKVWLSPNNQRSKRAINMIKEFATRHMKTEQIKIDNELSEAVWKRGIRNPPRKIRVKMAKTDEGYVLVTTYEEEKAKEVDEKKDKKKKEKPAQKESEKKEPEEAKSEKPKAEESKPKEEKPKVEEKPKQEKPKKEAPKKDAKKPEAKKPAKKTKSK